MRNKIFILNMIIHFQHVQHMCDTFRRGSWPWRNSVPRFPSRLRGTRTALWRKRTIFRWCYSRSVFVISPYSHAKVSFGSFFVPLIENNFWCFWTMTFFQEKENLVNLEKKYSELTGALGFPVSPISMKEVSLIWLCLFSVYKANLLCLDMDYGILSWTTHVLQAWALQPCVAAPKGYYNTMDYSK